MGGLGPGIGGFELLVIGLVALLVVGPKDLPVLMRRVGQMLAKARAMANEFRTSFDEMARQSELDELRKEVEALRSGQGAMYPLGAEADAAFKEINAGLTTPPAAAALPTPAVDEWPDASPVPLPEPEAKSKPNPRPRSKRSSSTAETSATPAKTKKTAKAGEAAAAKTRAPAKSAAKTQTSDAQAPAQASAKTKTPRKKAVEL